MDKKLTFKEKEALKSVAVDRDLYKRLKDKLEERRFGDQLIIWEPAYEAFLIEE